MFLNLQVLRVDINLLDYAMYFLIVVFFVILFFDIIYDFMLV